MLILLVNMSVLFKIEIPIVLRCNCVINMNEHRIYINTFNFLANDF